ncbi:MULTISPECIES: SDR family oxidoreductase [Halocynthiibacter]|uniref:SDR family oxidoreductase n=1 Tax=Halocynthiibacter halioticoli TaxID=2986804 RepID=A0AAE3LRD9_9RHOB|nr:MULTISPECIES: SDR family oxidoreductase [Halocynthiibacter]MCV6825477.1 SDR family oxidoreductase [Halocynthiibacter halioticoli]MCW4058478.1 SDR family oxidoreductase [Halocynthiibacter sp. SDUM655004]
MAEPKSKRLEGKIAVVTAAGLGIGRAVAERMRDEGAQVFASDLNPEPLKTLSGVESAQLDATDIEAVEAYFSQFDRIDTLVHCVGYVHQGTIEECSPADWQRSTSITLDSAYNVLKAAVPSMKEHGGSLTTIASVASSLKGFPRRAAYGAAKGGVIGLTKAMAADYLPNKLRCNAVCPGTVDSPSLRDRVQELAESMGSEEEAWKFFLDRQPSGRLGTPEEIAGICAFLATDDASFITGQCLQVDGGITI